jgi:uncharacterized protein DUF5924/DUF2914 family protein
MDDRASTDGAAAAPEELPPGAGASLQPIAGRAEVEPAGPIASALHARPWMQRLHRLLPWLSLGLGIPSAIAIDRGPKRAALIAVAASGVWIILTATHWLLRVELVATDLGPMRQRLLLVARFSSVLVTQSIVQLCLFFALPFYFRASTLAPGDIDPGHALFMLGLGALCAGSLWDPWTEWLFRRPSFAPLLPAVASFVALNTVLPGFGLSTQRSLWLAAFGTVLGVALMLAGAAPPGRRLRRAAKVALLGLSIPLALALGAARIVPPAPLRLMRHEFGVAREGKWIAKAVTSLAEAPDRLICATAIASPTGLKDRLFHVWRKDGVERARMELVIVGGRQEGYRTMSWLQGFGAGAAGRYSCSVVTAAGQYLGTRRVRLGAEPKPQR